MTYFEQFDQELQMLRRLNSNSPHPKQARFDACIPRRW